MFRKLHPALAVSQREDLFLEYSLPPRTRDFALGLRARVSALPFQMDCQSWVGMPPNLEAVSRALDISSQS